MSMYVYAVSKVNSFLANLCSIPPRKCNMSLQQIPSMMQQCLRRWSYYFSKVCHQFMQHVFQKKCSMKLRFLSRTWPNISKLEHTVYKKVQMAESYYIQDQSNPIQSNLTYSNLTLSNVISIQSNPTQSNLT